MSAKETEKAGEQMLALIEKGTQKQALTRRNLRHLWDCSVNTYEEADVTADIDTTANTDNKQIRTQVRNGAIALLSNHNQSKSIKTSLKKTNVHLETVIGGEAAIEACRKRNYDLIFLDHLMPQPDGIATLHQIQEDTAGRNRYTTVIVLTANALERSRCI